MFFFLTFNVDKIVVKIYNNDNVKFFRQDLIDITLKTGWLISISERHYLVLKVVIPGPEDCFVFVTFSNFHLMIDLDWIRLGELSSPTLSI